MDQSCGLEGLAGDLVGQLVRGKFAQLVVNERHKVGRCLGIAGLGRLEDRGRLGVTGRRHGPILTTKGTKITKNSQIIFVSFMPFVVT